MIIAKPVIDNQFWILQQNDQKIGNITATADGSYEVKILNSSNVYKTLPMIRRTGIEFVPAEKRSRVSHNEVHGYVTGCRAYNGMWDVKHRLPLFTKTQKSMSWFAAGYYWIKQHNNWRLKHNPKLILLERYAYHGPFATKDQAGPEPTEIIDLCETHS